MSRPGQGAESPGPVGVPFGQDREPPATGEPDSLFSAVGGEETFRRLVSEFYAGVSADPVLRPLYPEDDLGPAEERLRMFLVQFWGGPRTYSQLRGHPRLRLRHAPFPIGVRERDAWLSHMRRALDHLGLDDDHDAQLWAYFVNAAEMLRNAPE